MFWFKASTNEADYEASRTRLGLVKTMGTEKLEIFNDS